MCEHPEFVGDCDADARLAEINSEGALHGEKGDGTTALHSMDSNGDELGGGVACSHGICEKGDGTTDLHSWTLMGTNMGEVELRVES